MKKVAYLGMVSAAVLTLAACGGGKTDDKAKDESGSKKTELADKQEFDSIVVAEMPSADSSLNTDVIGSVALNSVYEGIYRIGKDGKPAPAGASEKAEVSEDGKTYKIKLREDAKWSDGKPVTAKDYVFGWQRSVDPATEAEYAYIFEPVKNAGPIAEGKMDKKELGIKAVGDYELEVTLERPTPYFDHLLAFTTFNPQRQDIVEKYGKDYTTTSEKAVYNGPFVLADFDGPGTDTEWTYKKNPEYWDKKTVKLDKINVKVVKESATSLNLYQDGQAEDVILSGELAQQMANDPDFVTDRRANSTYMEMNQIKEDSPFKNKNLRKAISYSINRKALVEKILGDGSVESTGLVPSAMSYNPETEKDFAKDSGKHLEYNKKKAAEYWEKAQKELGVKELKFDIITSDTDSAKKVTEYVQGAIEESLKGVKVTVSPVPFAVRLDRTNKGDFEVALAGWAADYADPSSFTDLFVTGNSYNRGKYSNKEYDAKVKASGTTHSGDPKARWQDMLDAEKIIMDDAGVIPLYQKAEAHLRTQKIKDVVVNGAGANYDYKWAYKVK